MISGRYRSAIAAKSAIGICNPDITMTHTALAVFLCVKHGHIRDLWWAVWGRFGAPGFIVTGIANPIQFTTP
nr:MAG: Ash protein family protein [Bacteriophage sp.]